MKLKDEFYTDAYGIGGLMMDLPTCSCLNSGYLRNKCKIMK